MGNFHAMPDHILVEFIRVSGKEVRLVDLGTKFLSAFKIDPANLIKPFRIAILKKETKFGNALYDYSQNIVPLPDGLATFMKVAGAIVPMGETTLTTNNNPKRQGTTLITVAETKYQVTVIIVQSKKPFWIKVIAHKQSENLGNVIPAKEGPQGGIILQ